MKAMLRALVRNKPADYLEVRLEETHLTHIQFMGPALQNLAESVAFGGNVRALVKGGWGFVSFNRLEDLDRQVDLAIAQARQVAAAIESGATLAPVDPIEDTVPLPPGVDPGALSLQAKKDLLESYNAAILAFGPPVVSSQIRYRDIHSRILYANSDGTCLEQERLDVAANLVAVARRNGLTQIGFFGMGGKAGYGVLQDRADEVTQICETARDSLAAPVVRGGEYTVILDPRLAGVFAHEAFGHLSEADNVYENPRLGEIMTLGRRFGEPLLNIYDSGREEGLQGYLKYDDEGVPTRKTYLIRDGLLVGRLHSRETAGRMGEPVTGSARALDYRFPPIPRMRTTAIEAGDASFDEMLEGVELGVYAKGAYGGQTAGEMFTFTATEGFMIRGGRLAERVRDVTLTGNVFATLKNIDRTGRDYTVEGSAGGCGKGEQNPLPCSSGSPHIRIQKVIVGGKGS
ncbi:MAG: TldD/PmbA family protein [bacterium]|nr:TldD/PmbA family protein [bacterium]